MAIDADLNAGMIDEVTARKRREAVAREAEFYGAMDGAARFNQRDSMATILITAINIIAGLLIGTLQQGVALGDALKTYTTLTVGDGLVTMIPSLLVSVAGGMVLTRASSAGALGAEIGSQLLGRSATLYMSGGVLGVMALVPGLPKLPFLLVSAALLFAGRQVARRSAAQVAEGPADAAKKDDAKAQSDNLAGLLRMDELSLEIGFQLIPLVDEKQGGQMLSRIRTLRRHLATELGFVVPPVHIADNLRLKPREYVISLRGVEIGRWQTESNQLLAVSADPNARTLPGKETREPAFGVNARWIAPALEEQALAAGYSVVDPTTVITMHLSELVRRCAHELLSRAETKRLIDTLNDSHPKLIEELIPKVMTLGEVQRVLQQLLREQVSIRDLGTILEVLVEAAPANKSLPHLVELCRQAMGRRLIQPHLDGDGALPVLLLDPAVEEELQSCFGDGGRTISDRGALTVPVIRRMADSLKKLSGGAAATAWPVLLCQSPARYYIRRWLEPAVPRVTVLAPSEVPADVRIRSLGTVR
jgi:flagellar biosynthesis protein FlhA